MKEAIFLIVGLTIAVSLVAQDQSQVPHDSTHLVVSTKYLQSVSDKAYYIERKLEAKTASMLKKFQRLELHIQNKLKTIDSLKAKELLVNMQEQYSSIERKMQSTTLTQFIPSLDTIETSLKFLQQHQQFLSSAKNAREKVQQALKQVNGMKGKLQQAEELKAFLRERKQYLKNQLEQLGFARELRKLSKQSYYAIEQLNEYKSLLKDHKKAERKVLELLSRTKLFQNFMRKNSMLASLFRLPGDSNEPINMASLAGLQTRVQVTNLIQQQVASGGSNAQQQIQQNIQQAQGQLNELKNKMNQLGKGSSDDEMPEGFKPNNQKTKSFLRRLELGTNIQSQKANGYLPVSSDIGLSLGYKLNDRSIIGFGGSYRVGWGKDIRHINISHQGVGLRSFVDWKIKGSFWLSGGYEMNHRSEFSNIDELKNADAWQRSGLLGLSKVVSLKTKFFKKTKIQLMWDFLSYQQVPRTQPIIFRIGYNLK